MNDTDPGRRPRYAEFVNTFVPFGLLLSAALLLPETTEDPLLGRIKNTIYLATVFLIPALCLRALPQYAPAQGRYALLFGTFSYLAYMVHFYFAGMVYFGGVHGILTHMRPPVAWTNLVLTAWWTLHELIAWFGPARAGWARWEGRVFYLFLFLTFVVTELYLRPTPIPHALGLVLAISVPLCLLVRLGQAPARARA
jgi:hypothetical protein